MSSVPDLLYLNRILHTEQFNAMQEILGKFAMNKRQVMLLAQMQSGKTSIFLSVALSMIRTGKVKNVIILCGSNENELHDQLVKDSTNMALKFQMVGAAVTILKSSDLKTTLTIGSDTLVVWDESHYAQGIQNRPFKLLQRSGLLVGGTAVSDAKWAEKNCYFLSVSATPFAEFSDSLHKNFVESITRVIVRAEPGADYRGVEYFHTHGAIKNSFSIKENKAAFIALLTSFKTQRKYALIRSHRNLVLVRQWAAEVGIAYKNYTCASKELLNLDTLSEAPPCFTIIGLKGMCRMGKVVPKEHIAFVFEEAKSSKSDTLLQSLLGRVCGYYNTPLLKACKPLIFLPAEFSKVDETTKLSEIERYIRNTHGEVIIPAKAAYIAENSAATDKFLLEKPIWITLDDEDPEEEDGDGEWLPPSWEEDHEDFVVRKMLAHFTANPLSDPIQQAEVLARLDSDTPSISFHKLMMPTYTEKGHVARLVTSHQNGKRYHDPEWQGNHFKCFFQDDGIFHPLTQQMNGFFFAGWTENASEETQYDCQGRIVPTTGRECWNPKHTETTEAPFAIINSVSDLTALKPGQHVLFIKKTLKEPIIETIKAQKLKGRGGKIWSKNMKGNREDYDRIVFKMSCELQRGNNTTVIAAAEVSFRI
jgi:hypothetical protein